MNRPIAIVVLLLLAAGLLAAGLWGGLRASFAQQAMAEKTESKPAAKSPAKIDLNTPEGVLAMLRERKEASVALTARGQTIDDAPPFVATPRIDYIDYYPCSDCHEGEIANRQVRKLKDEHTDLDFQHGGGRFWCYDACHNPGNMDRLRLASGEKISFDQSYKLCGQCHFERQKDWYFGGHGKRAGTFEDPRDAPLTHDEFDWSDREKIATWQGKRVLHNCTDCHNAHSPSIKPFEPSPPPKVRAGLHRSDLPPHKHLRIWQEVGAEHSNGGAK